MSWPGSVNAQKSAATVFHFFPELKRLKRLQKRKKRERRMDKRRKRRKRYLFIRVTLKIQKIIIKLLLSIANI